MKRYQWLLSTIALLASGTAFSGCTPGGVGDPCIPEDEYYEKFAGYGVEEVNVEAMSFQCETRLCLVNHFQGRVTCPYGQTADDVNANPDDAGPQRCKVPDGKKKPVKVPVSPQLLSRRANNAVYCSCRCDGPDKTARYCKCPSGYSCTLLNEIPLGAGSSQLLGSYCVRNGTAYNKMTDNESKCEAGKANCDYEDCQKGVNPFGKECQ
jgi:hypothetical protein